MKCYEQTNAARHTMIYLIIFGMKGRSSKYKTGRFHCPNCDGERKYAWIRIRNWFTLFFIPIIPLNKVGEYIECEACASKYEPNE